MANALVLSSQGLTDTTLTKFLCFELHQPAPDGGCAQAHVLADLPNTQTVAFEHLNNLQFETRVKDSSGFGIAHVCCHFALTTYRGVFLN